MVLYLNIENMELTADEIKALEADEPEEQTAGEETDEDPKTNN